MRVFAKTVSIDARRFGIGISADDLRFTLPAGFDRCRFLVARAAHPVEHGRLRFLRQIRAVDPHIHNPRAITHGFAAQGSLDIRHHLAPLGAEQAGEGPPSQFVAQR